MQNLRDMRDYLTRAATRPRTLPGIADRACSTRTWVELWGKGERVGLAIARTQRFVPVIGNAGLASLAYN